MSDLPVTAADVLVPYYMELAGMDTEAAENEAERVMHCLRHACGDGTGDSPVVVIMGDGTLAYAENMGPSRVGRFWRHHPITEGGGPGE